MEVLVVLLLIAAVVLFVIAAIPATAARVNLGWLGAACLAGAFLVPAAQAL
jgi:hypothetical protein